ncbi:MAG TPA: PilZ domain-containing protein [Dongiaceae bacterium]
MDTNDKRRHERFGYDGTAMLVFDDISSRRTLAITNYRNISQGGACILTPNTETLQIGDHIFIMPERYRRKREAVVVDLGTGRLHLELSRNQELTDFELAELIQRLDYRKVP